MGDLVEFLIPSDALFIFRVILGSWWIWLPPISWKFFQTMYKEYVTGNFIKNNFDFVLLEIILEGGEGRTPKSMEKVITSFQGMKTSYSWWEVNIQGAVGEMFSFEIVSIGGNIHYLVRVLRKYQKLAESAIYGAFPDVEIHEVEDYVNIDRKGLEVDYDIFGTSLKLAKADGFPIRTYYEFLDDDPDVKINDPMSQVLEILSSIGPNEQMWIQINASVASSNWIENGKKEIEKLTGTAKIDSRTWFEKALGPLFEVLTLGILKASPAPEAPEQKFGIAQNLTPGKSEALKAIEHNITKPGFQCWMRIIYISPIAEFSSTLPKALIGSFQQFNDATLNSFVIDESTITIVENMFAKPEVAAQRMRKNLILDNYIKRKPKGGTFSFNTEELTTIYHFPGNSVTTSTLSRVRSKRASAPPSLPVIEEL